MSNGENKTCIKIKIGLFNAQRKSIVQSLLIFLDMVNTEPEIVLRNVKFTIVEG